MCIRDSSNGPSLTFLSYNIIYIHQKSNTAVVQSILNKTAFKTTQFLRSKLKCIRTRDALILFEWTVLSNSVTRMRLLTFILTTVKVIKDICTMSQFLSDADDPILSFVLFAFGLIFQIAYSLETMNQWNSSCERKVIKFDTKWFSSFPYNFFFFSEIRNDWNFLNNSRFRNELKLCRKPADRTKWRKNRGRWLVEYLR